MDFFGKVSMTVHVDAFRYLPVRALLAKTYAAFVTPSDPGLRSSIDLHLGDFPIDLRGRHVVDDAFMVAPGRVYSRNAHKIARWEVEVAGLDSENTSIWISGNVFSYLVFPELIHQILFFKLGMENVAFLHALGVAKDGKALVVIGRSGIGKSLLAGKYLRDGYKLLGDDTVFIDPDGRVHGFPIPLGIRSLATSYRDFGLRLTLSDRFYLGLVKSIRWLSLGSIGLLFKVSAHRLGQRLEKNALATAVVFGLPGEPAGLVPAGDMEGLLDRMVLNSRFEAVILTKIIESYAYIYPESPVGGFWQRQREVFRSALRVPAALLATIPSRMTEGHYQSLKKALEHG